MLIYLQSQWPYGQSEWAGEEFQWISVRMITCYGGLLNGGSATTTEPTTELPLLRTDFVYVKFFGHNLKVSRRRVTMCVAAEYMNNMIYNIIYNS
jgi:hypothetical protein